MWVAGGVEKYIQQNYFTALKKYYRKRDAWKTFWRLKEIITEHLVVQIKQSRRCERLQVCLCVRTIILKLGDL